MNVFVSITIAEKKKRNDEITRQKSKDKETIANINKELIVESKKITKKQIEKEKLQQDMNNAFDEIKRRKEESRKKEELENQKLIQVQIDAQQKEKSYQEMILKKKKEHELFLEKAAEKTAVILSQPNSKDILLKNNEITGLMLKKYDNTEKLDKMKKDMLNTLNQQIKERDEKKKEEKLEKLQQAELWKKDAEITDQINKAKMEKAQRERLENMEYLKHQMEKNRREKDEMTKEELLMNQQLLAKANKRLNNKVA